MSYNVTQFRSILSLLFIVLMGGAFVLAGCTVEGFQNDDRNNGGGIVQNRAPIAHIEVIGAVGTTVRVGEDATFDGSESNDPDNDQLDFQWTLTQSPDESDAELSDASGEQTTLTPDVAGDFTVELTVFDGEKDSTETETVTAQSN